MPGLDSAGTTKADNSALTCFLCPRGAPLPLESLILSCTMSVWPWPGAQRQGLEKNLSAKKQNPNQKWFILGFPVSECLLKTQEQGQAFFLAVRPHSERQGHHRNSAADRLVYSSVYFWQGFICPSLGKSNPRLPPMVEEGTFLLCLFNNLLQDFRDLSN